MAESKSHKKESVSFKIKLPKNRLLIPTFVISAVAAAAIILLAVVYFGSYSHPKYSGVSVVPPQQVGQNVVAFLNAHTNSTIQLANVTSLSGIYQINVVYQGQTLPVYSTQDGQYLLQAIVPIQ